MPLRSAACPTPTGQATARIGLGAILTMLLVGPVAAQTLEHGALEQLFGEAVTTSAIGKPQRVPDVPAAMEIITAEQIRRSGAHDIPEVLARYTTLDVQQYGAQDYSVGVRGYTTPASSRLLVLVDGRQVYLDELGQTVWAAVPVQLAEIRQIEVVKGPNSALFGFNAAAGVINIITYSPLHDRVTSGTVRLGTNGYREASGVATAPIGSSGGIRLSAGVREQHSWSQGFSAVDSLLGGRADPSRVTLAADSLFRVTDTVQMGFDASYSRVIEPELLSTGLMPRGDRIVWSIRGRIAAETDAGLIEASLYRNSDTVRPSNMMLRGTQSVTVLQLSDTLKLGASHTLRSFVEYRYNEGQVDRAGINFSVAATGMMWNWAISEQFETTAALRYDHLWLGTSGHSDMPAPFPPQAYDRDYGTLAWNLGLVWKPSELDAVRVTAARGISVPSLIQLGPASIQATPLGAGFAGSPLLRPTVVDNYELGYQRNVGVIDGRVQASVFYQVNRDLNSGLAAMPTLFPPAVPLPTSVPFSIGTSHANGVELSATGRLGHGFDWDLRYRVVTADANLIALPLEYKHASPRHQVVSRIGWAQGSWQADLFGRYATSMQGYRFMERGPVLVRVDDHASLAARVGYRINQHMTLALEGSSLLHERQRQGIGLEAERRIYLSLRTDF